MDCELCGRKATGKARIENTVVSVCDDCSRFGEKVYEQKVYDQKAVQMPDRPRQSQPEEIFFVSNFSGLVKKSREKKSLSREQLAAKIKEKAFVIERIEKGMRPEKHVAEKLEKALNISLLSSVDVEKTVFNKKQSSDLTLGDVVVVRKRKK